eukprot:Gb_17229 [translate_table: standard]
MFMYSQTIISKGLPHLHFSWYSAPLRKISVPNNRLSMKMCRTFSLNYFVNFTSSRLGRTFTLGKFIFCPDLHRAERNGHLVELSAGKAIGFDERTTGPPKKK